MGTSLISMAALEVWKGCDQWQEALYVPLAKNFIARRMWLDRPPDAAVPRSPRELAVHAESQVGAGPALLESPHCKHCGRTSAYPRDRYDAKEKFSSRRFANRRTKAV